MLKILTIGTIYDLYEMKSFNELFLDSLTRIEMIHDQSGFQECFERIEGWSWEEPVGFPGAPEGASRRDFRAGRGC